MLFTVSVHHGTDFLLIVAVGRASAADYCGLLQLAGEVGRRLKYSRLLLDLLAVDLRADEAERHSIGALARQALAGFERIAAAVAPEQYTGVLESSAQSLGVNAKAFARIEHGIRWLQDETDAGRPRDLRTEGQGQGDH